jgi:hypothetical protein
MFTVIVVLGGAIHSQQMSRIPNNVALNKLKDHIREQNTIYRGFYSLAVQASPASSVLVLRWSTGPLAAHRPLPCTDWCSGGNTHRRAGAATANTKKQSYKQSM